METGNYLIKWDYSVGMLRMMEVQNTFCVIISKDGFKASHGVAYCLPTDIFSKDKGRKLSLAKAFHSNPNITKEERTQVWEAYRNLTKVPRW